MAKKKEKKVAPGKILPPAPDEEFSPEAVRAFAETVARQWWQENALPKYKNLTSAKQTDA